MRYGIVGNCAYSALLQDGSVEWLCWPRMDSSFVFGPMLDRERGGTFRVELVDAERVEQHYVRNTNIMRTVFHGPSGSLELTDFAPRCWLHNRAFKPTMFVRVLQPLSGEPLIRVTCQPTGDYGRVQASSWRGSNHLEYQDLASPVRLTTNMPLTYVDEARPFALTGRKHLVLTWGEPLEADIAETAESFLDRTIAYWRRWVKHTRVPRDYQQEVVRSALVLKLHQYEDTGAILAATTTSIPEFPGSGRNWDYRFCWLRDTYFCLEAFERLGHFDEMEGFLAFMRTIIHRFGHDRLQPLYAINGDADLTEEVLDHLDGYQGEKPVRIGNQAHEHIQNDVYGETILAISRLITDTRFDGDDDHNGVMNLVVRLLDQIEARMEESDAGLWELRGSQSLHSFTVLTHWAGANRAVELARTVGDEALATRAENLASVARDILETRCWDAERGVLTQAAGASNLDASLLLAVHFGFWAPDDPRAHTHVDAIAAELRIGKLVKRYNVADDFGDQEAAFTVCSFWLAEALARLGRKAEAKELFDYLLAHRNELGLLSEDILPATGQLAGNFPQTYSHVGLINAAFRLSRSWE